MDSYKGSNFSKTSVLSLDTTSQIYDESWIEPFFNNFITFIKNNDSFSLQNLVDQHELQLKGHLKSSPLPTCAYDEEVIQSLFFCFLPENAERFYLPGITVFDTLYVRTNETNFEVFLENNIFELFLNLFQIIPKHFQLVLLRLILHISHKYPLCSPIINNLFGENFLFFFIQFDHNLNLRGEYLRMKAKHLTSENDTIDNFTNILETLRFSLTDQPNLFDIHHLRCVSLDAFHFLCLYSSQLYDFLLEHQKHFEEIIFVYLLSNDFGMNSCKYQYMALLICADIMSTDKCYLHINLKDFIERFMDLNYFPNEMNEFSDAPVLVCRIIRKFLEKRQQELKYLDFLYSNGFERLKIFFENGNFELRKEALALVNDLAYGPTVVVVYIIENGFMDFLVEFLDLDFCQTGKILSVLYNLAMVAKKKHYTESAFNEIFIKEDVIEPMLELKMCEIPKIAELANEFLDAIEFNENMF